ncbi:MAG: hypothetical protein AB1427_16950 [Thermodesulfobacteriota bacterium]
MNAAKKRGSGTILSPEAIIPIGIDPEALKGLVVASHHVILSSRIVEGEYRWSRHLVTPGKDDFSEPKHDLPPPPNVRKKFHGTGKSGTPGFVELDTWVHGTGHTSDGCEYTSYGILYRHMQTTVCETHTNVVIVTQKGGVPVGAGVSIAGFGGSGTSHDAIYDVVHYQIGAIYIYEFRLLVYKIVTTCPDGTIRIGYLTSFAGWGLVDVVDPAICCQSVLAPNVDSKSTAELIATQTGYLRAFPALNLYDYH